MVTMRLGSASPDSSVCMSNTSMNDVPPPCDDGSDSDATEKEQHHACLELYAGTLHAARSSPKVQQCLKEGEQCRTALTCHFALDVIIWSTKW